MSALASPPTESSLRKALTTCLLLLSIAINALPILFLWNAFRPENEMGNMVVVGLFAALIPICAAGGLLTATLAAVFRRGVVRVLALLIAAVDMLIVCGAVVLLI